jgi:hypothetical protein
VKMKMEMEMNPSLMMNETPTPKMNLTLRTHRPPPHHYLKLNPASYWLYFDGRALVWNRSQGFGVDGTESAR